MFKPIHTLLFNKYYIDELYSKTIIQPVLKASDKIILAFDTYIIEGIVNGLPNLIGLFSKRFRVVQTGILANYGLVMAIGALFIIGYVIFIR